MSIQTKELHTDNAVEHTKDEAGKDTTCPCCKTHEVTKVAMIRASGYELRNILPNWFKGLGAKTIISHEQSESEGNVTLTVFYR